MRHEFYLAWRYLHYHRARTLILVICLSLLATLPLSVHFLLKEGEKQMTERALATPLLVGAKGSSVDLMLSALFFNKPTPPIAMAEADRVTATGWAEALPIYFRLRVMGHPLVGITLDYLDHRNLKLAEGQMLALLGECLLGADAAKSLKLRPGDSVLTSPENVFDLAGTYPLKLHVTGVLRRTHTPDDRAIFVDLPTAWLIDGIGHGHMEPKSPSQSAFGLLRQPGTDWMGEAGPTPYTEVTPDNLDSFHFHGDPARFPITAVIALPHDRKTATLLRGRYVAEDHPTQIIKPLPLLHGLLDEIFRVAALFDAVLVLVGFVTLLTIGLVFALSLRLRQREIQTIFLLGCARMTVVRLVVAELLLLLVASGMVGWLLLELIRRNADTIIWQALIF